MWCIGSWIIGICIALPTFHPCCRVVLRPQFYSWVYDETPGGSAYSIIDLVTSVAVCVECAFANVKLFVQMGVCVLFLNGRVFYTIRTQHAATTSLNTPAHISVKQDRERKLFIQFFITVIVFIVYDIMFNVLPVISKRYSIQHVTHINCVYNLSEYIGISCYIAYIANCSINGYIYVLMNGRIRKKVTSLLKIVVYIDMFRH
jgi:hypothetical protein